MAALGSGTTGGLRTFFKKVDERLEESFSLVGVPPIVATTGIRIAKFDQKRWNNLSKEAGIRYLKTRISNPPKVETDSYSYPT
jgi:hypothetical protein